MQTFSSFSGFKVNIGKRECFPLNNVAKQILAQSLPFHQAPSSFRYLGIKISCNFPSLHKNNILKLVKEIKSDFQQSPLVPVGKNQHN